MQGLQFGSEVVPQRREPEGNHGVLGGSRVVVSGVISPLIWVISIVTLLITLLITSREPPSKPRPPPETSCAVGACRRPQHLSPSCMQKVQDPLPVAALAFGFRFRVRVRGFSEFGCVGFLARGFRVSNPGPQSCIGIRKHIQEL